MFPEIILPRDSEPFRVLHRAAIERRGVFLAGLPGVGKSLLLQQLALIAAEAGRAVHLLQWDVARGAFETPAILARYPEVDGVTHAAIRKAAGLWTRRAVGRWDERHAAPREMLIGETPLIGNRLIELARQQDDAVEPLLAGGTTLFLIPVPSRGVRQVIEGARVREMARPLHERERGNAPPGVVRALWEELARAARHLGVAGLPSGGERYDPDVYLAVYRRLLRHRRTATLPITEVLPVRASAYDLTVAGELIPSSHDVERAMAQVETLPEERLRREVEAWFRV